MTRIEKDSYLHVERVHDLSWRGWVPVRIIAVSREEAIAKARESKPLFVPAGTDLLYWGIRR